MATTKKSTPKAAPKGGGGKKQATHEVLVVGSKVKDVIRSLNLRSSGDLVVAISEKVHQILHGAAERAQKNGRATVNPHDL
jgi:hypothetical protein